MHQQVSDRSADDKSGRHSRSRRFAAAAERRETELRASFNQAGVDALEIATDGEIVDAIMRFADLRKRRSQLAAGGPVPQQLRARA